MSNGGGSIVGLSGVGNIGNISTVGISNVVVDVLGSAIGKSNRVRSGGGISISVFFGIEVGSAVVV